MDLHQLRTFVAIADAGGVARAATRLNLSQPAASRQMQVLEAELGVQLFDRIGRRVRLTSEGEDLLGAAGSCWPTPNPCASAHVPSRRGTPGSSRLARHRP